MLLNEAENFKLKKSPKHYSITAIALIVLVGSGYWVYRSLLSQSPTEKLSAAALGTSDSTMAAPALLNKMDSASGVSAPRENLKARRAAASPDNSNVSAAEVHDKLYVCLRGACLVKEGAPDTLWQNGRIVRIGRKPDTIDLSVVLWNRVKTLSNVSITAPDSAYNTKWQKIKLNMPPGSNHIYIGDLPKDEYRPSSENRKFTFNVESLAPPADSTICLFLTLKVSATELGEVFKPVVLFAKVVPWKSKVDSGIEHLLGNNADPNSNLPGRP